MSEPRIMLRKRVMEKFGYPEVHNRLVRIGCDVTLEHVTQALTGECDMDLDLAGALCDVLDLQGDELREFAVAYMYRHDPSARSESLTDLGESRVASSKDRDA